MIVLLEKGRAAMIFGSGDNVFNVITFQNWQ